MPEDEFAARRRDRPLAPAPVGTPEGAAVPGPAAEAGGTIERAVIRGTVERAELGPLPEGAVLFLLVRPAGATGGPPLAVRRLAPSTFPIEFELSSGDAMIPGTTFPDLVTVEARLDMDGNASTEGPADEEARSEPVRPDAAGVTLSLR